MFAALLVGQPASANGVLTALDQRIAVRRALAGKALNDTADYISHHVEVASRTDPLVPDEAIALIYVSARGYTRTVTMSSCRPWPLRSPSRQRSSIRIVVTETGHN